jgi:hypothetical protein
MSKTNNWPMPSMIIVTGTWGPTETFKLIPATKDCPYTECIYNHAAKTLAVIGINKKEAFHMMPRLDDNGIPQQNKAGGKENPTKQQRVTLETFSEYYVMGTLEVEEFVKNVAVNADTYDYGAFLNAPSMETPGASGITKRDSKIILA